METQRQRMKRRISERTPTVIQNRERMYKPTHPIHKILMQHPIKMKNRAQRRQNGLHKGLPASFGTQTVMLPNCQKRIYLGKFKDGLLAGVTNTPSDNFGAIKSGVIISRSQYFDFLNQQKVVIRPVLHKMDLAA